MITSIITYSRTTGSPLIGQKNGSIFLTNRLMRTVNKMAVLWEELENLLNKPKPSYREIRLMRGLPVLKNVICGYGNHMWHIEFITLGLWPLVKKFNVFTCDYHNHAWHFPIPKSQSIGIIPIFKTQHTFPVDLGQ